MTGSVQPASDPTPEDVALAVALATLNAHAEVEAEGGSICAICEPPTRFPCVFVLQARQSIEHGPAERPA